MKLKFSGLLIFLFFLSSCASIPKETVLLSETIGKDIRELHRAHRKAIELQFDEMEAEVNTFIREVYSPFVIHFVLKEELKAKEEGRPSIYTSLEKAGRTGGKESVDAALYDTENFLFEARKIIEAKREEALRPVLQQKAEVLNALDQSYANMTYANTTLTGYLKSARTVKESQNEAMAILGLRGSEELITDSLVRVSESLSKALKIGEDIDVKSDDAMMKINNVFEEINKITKDK